MWSRRTRGPARRAFLNAALKAHLGAELDGDIPAIVATFAPGGHLDFNGKVYDTPDVPTEVLVKGVQPPSGAATPAIRCRASADTRSWRPAAVVSRWSTAGARAPRT